jgi:hypothetical protein
MYRIQRFYMLSLALLFLLVFQFAQPLPVFAQEDPCDPDLDQSATDQLGYRLRGDRCEGRYIQEVGSTILFPVSLTKFFEDYDLNSGEDLIVEWTVLTDQTVHLRAQSLKYRCYYRMDTIRPPGDTSYRWPTGILAALEMLRKNVGVVGWTSYPVGGTDQDVYLPLQIGQEGNASQSRTYRVVLWPGRELAEVFISLAPVKADGSLGTFIKKGEPLEYGYYPAEQGIEFEISDLETAGVYYLKISTTLSEGGSEVIEHWFYHAG